ncbi:Elongation factor P [Mesomycoplasma conjunctivae]|uniref:Elongation factor P n=1 Tax=Mesomycoplasma conjunctivae (strain ATCC 25834 / NCTC 10147 / HRC/581) TaxID=572263 RepID=C5J6B0_MESCH|nr:elongation factor P [Mesomycoplasma conjunctivae]CAT05002.1 Elongation factor P [Mesomycoplasma conjunctivae]VEU66337.1 Elongation factor P [Mesomycoplasma conjunctivae]
MINVNEFRPGITFKDEGDIFVVLESQHSKQGRGQANVKAKVKNLKTGAIIVKTYSGGERVEKAHIEKVSMSYLYNDGDAIVLMNDETFEQISIEVSKVEWEIKFLVDGAKVKVRKYGEEILDIELAPKVELLVTQAFDAVKGNTSSNPTKKITLETGYEIDAPLFIKEGEKIVVSTETGKYVSRGN